MNVISKFLIGVGLFITLAGNLATFYALHTAVNGMRNGESSGIALVAWGMSSGYSYSLVSLIGCFLLIVGIVLAALRRGGRP
jgi:hypothetical protein